MLAYESKDWMLPPLIGKLSNSSLFILLMVLQVNLISLLFHKINAMK